MIPEGLKRPQIQESILVKSKWDLFNSLMTVWETLCLIPRIFQLGLKLSSWGDSAHKFLLTCRLTVGFWHSRCMTQVNYLIIIRSASQKWVQIKNILSCQFPKATSVKTRCDCHALSLVTASTASISPATFISSLLKAFSKGLPPYHISCYKCSCHKGGYHMILQISRSQINNEKGCTIYFSKKIVSISLNLNISFWLQKK